MRINRRQALAAASGTVILALALAGCSNPSSAEISPQATAPQPQAGDDSTPPTMAPVDGTQPDGFAIDGVIVDICAWLDFEMPYGATFQGSYHDKPGTWDDDLLGYSVAQMTIPEKSAVITAGPDHYFSVACQVQYSGSSLDVFTVSLITGAMPTDGEVLDQGLPYAYEYRGHELRRGEEDTLRVTQARLGDSHVLRLTIAQGDENAFAADINHGMLSEVFEAMIDAWDAQRVPYFTLGADANIRDPWNVCRYVADDVLGFAAARGTADAPPYALVTHASDWDEDPTYTCTARPRAEHDSETDIEIEVELVWAPSEQDTTFGGNFASEGCEEGARHGVMMACQPGWVYYSTAQGRWLIMVNVEDNNASKSWVNAETTSVEEQRAVEELASRVAQSLQDVTPGTQVERQLDPRQPERFSSPTPPVEMTCPQGTPFSAFQSDNAVVLLCLDRATGERSVTGVIDGERFAVEAGLSSSQLQGYAVVYGDDRVYDVVFDEYTISVVEGRERVFKEYLNVLWISEDSVG